MLKKILGTEKQVNFQGISIDTRKIKKGNLFLAIKGKKNDGNKFVAHALRKGAGCIVSSFKFNKNKKK